MCLLVVVAAGCGDPPTTADAGRELDANVSDAGPAPSAICDELGLPAAPMQARTGAGFGDTAGDFTAATLDGTYHFADRFSGCESYVFFTYLPDLRASPSGAWEGDTLFASGVNIYQHAPRTAHFFFLSDEVEADARAVRMQSLAASLEAGLEVLVEDPAERAFWRSHFHFVTDRATEVDGSVGEHLRDYLAYVFSPDSIVDLGDRGMVQAPLPWVFGIDRAQRFDPGGSLAPAVGVAPSLEMGAYLGQFYDYRAALDARLAAQTDAAVVPLLDERTTERVFIRDVDLGTLDAVDTLEVDVEILCDADNPFACSEWDRIASVALCVDGAPCTERREIARWITPYWRRGRQHWVIDASPMLGLLRGGGPRTFRVELGPDFERPTEWVARVALRLRATGTTPRAAHAELAFVGGAFDASYNDREPFSFTPPADATRVELVTILSGHGQTAGDSCAEWCDHQHVFTVNGAALPALAHDGAPIGSARGCADRADEGALPGQWGNWAQARAYWCPGLPVDAHRRDITSMVTPGAANELTYAGLFAGGAPRGGDIALSAYVVSYR